MIGKLRRKAIARLSHVFSTFIVKAHADWRTHERRFMTTTTVIETTTTPTSCVIKLWWTLPLLRGTLMWLLGRRAIRMLLEWWWLLWPILGLLIVVLRCIIWMVILCR